MNQCTARCLRADEPPARQERPPTSVDHRWRWTTRLAAAVKDVTARIVDGSVAKVDVGAVDVSP
jgi:hypothetical protein